MKKFLYSVLTVGALTSQLYAASAHAGTILVANVLSNTVSLIDDRNLQWFRDIQVGFHPHEVAVTPQGDYALVSNYGTLEKVIAPGHTLSVIDVKNAHLVQNINLAEGSRPHGIRFISDSTALVTAQGIQALLVVDITAGKVVQTISLPGAGAHMVAVDSAHHYAYVVNDDSGTVVKVDLTSFTPIGELKVGEGTEGVVLTADDKLLLAASRKSNTVSIVKLDDFSLIKQVTTEAGPSRVALFLNDKYAIVTNTSAGTAQLIELSSYAISKGFKTTQSHSLKHGNVLGGIMPLPESISVRQDGYTAYVTHLFAGNITLVNLISGGILNTFEAGCEPDGLAVSPVQVTG